MTLQKLIAELESATIKVSNDKINQTERNKMKIDFMQSLTELFADAGVEVSQTKEGLVLQIENKDQNIFIQLDASIKNLDFDLSSAIDEYESTLLDRAERQKALVQKREKALAEKAKTKK